jgi:hypothetical protein
MQPRIISASSSYLALIIVVVGAISLVAWLLFAAAELHWLLQPRSDYYEPLFHVGSTSSFSLSLDNDLYAQYTLSSNDRPPFPNASADQTSVFGISWRVTRSVLWRNGRIAVWGPPLSYQLTIPEL